MTTDAYAACRRGFIRLALLAPLAGCAALGGARTYTLDEAEIARLIAREFPFSKRLLEVLDVQVDMPRVRLLPTTNRIGTDLDVRASDRVFGRKLAGRLALDYALRYDEADQSLKLADVRVERLVFDELPAALQPLVNRLGPVLAEQLLNGLVLRRFKPDELRGVLGQGLKPGAITVTERGLELRLGEAR